MSLAIPARRTLLTPNQGVRPPPGFILLTDPDGAYLTDADGAYLMEAI